MCAEADAKKVRTLELALAQDLELLDLRAALDVLALVRRVIHEQALAEVVVRDLVTAVGAPAGVPAEALAVACAGRRVLSRSGRESLCRDVDLLVAVDLCAVPGCIGQSGGERRHELAGTREDAVAVERVVCVAGQRLWRARPQRQRRRHGLCRGGASLSCFDCICSCIPLLQMLICLVGPPQAGKDSLAQFLTAHHGYTRVHLGASPSSPTKSRRRQLCFASSSDFLDHATRTWRRDFVTTDLVSKAKLAEFAKRPFVAIVAVDAPLGVRFRRAVAKCVHRDARKLQRADLSARTGPLMRVALRLRSTSSSRPTISSTTAPSRSLQPCRRQSHHAMH